MVFLAVCAGLEAAALGAARSFAGPVIFWPAVGLLIAVLLHAPRGQWPVFLGLAGLASVLSSTLMGAGPELAAGSAAAHVAEGWLGARLLKRRKPRDSDLLQEWLADTGAIAIAAPAVGAAILATVRHFALGHAWPEAFESYLVAHALGNLIFFPLFSLVVGGALSGWFGTLTPLRRVELLAFTALVAATAFGALGQGAFFPCLLPLLLALIAACRFGMPAASICVTALAIAGWAAAAIAPIQAQFLQFYLVAAVLCLQPLASHITQNRRLSLALREKDGSANGFELSLQAKDFAIGESQGQYRLLADNMTDVILRADLEGVVLYASPSAARQGLAHPTELIGRNLLDIVHPSYGASFMSAYEEVIADRTVSPWTEFPGFSDGREENWFDTQIRCSFDENGNADGAVIVLRSIEERKQLEQQLFAATLTDPLTNLTNRRAFNSMLQYHLDVPIDGCLAMFDIDDFRSINRDHGHAIGDQVLTTVAKLMRALLRKDDIISRIGGERFAVLLSRATPDQAEVLCRRVVTTLSEMSDAADAAGPRITVSAGVARIEGTMDETMKRADAAVVIAKAKGRNRLEMATQARLSWVPGS